MSLAVDNAAADLTVRKLDFALGAEVRGLDLRQPLDANTFKAIHDAWMEHLVLIFPGQPVGDAEHIAFSRQFGDLEEHHQKILKSKLAPQIFRVGNVDDNNEVMPAKHPSMKQLSLARRWHTDSSFREVPSMGSLLHGLEASRTGGETWFINMYRVYEALPDSLKQKIAGRKARHDFAFLETLAPIKPLSAEEKAAMPPVWQPMVRRHSVTGRESLYISPIYNDAIEGMDDAEAQSLVAELTEFASQDEFVYRHRWEDDDIVIWDNRCTMHCVTPYDPTERRVMHRTTVVGDGPVIAA